MNTPIEAARVVDIYKLAGKTILFVGRITVGRDSGYRLNFDDGSFIDLVGDETGVIVAE